MATDYIKIPKINCIRTFEESGKFAYQLLPFHEVNLNYCYKSNFTDYFNFQLGIVGVDVHGTDSDLHAYFVDANNTVIFNLVPVKVISSVVTSYNTFQINQKLDVLSEGIYYFKLLIEKAGIDDVIIYSEPIYVKADHDNTVLLSATNDINDFDIIFNPTNVNPITFYRRIEGGFGSDGFLPQAKDTFYKNQNYDQILLNSVCFHTTKLTIGDAYGVSNDAIEIINRMLSCSEFKVNYIQYTKFDGAKLEPTRVDRFYPFASWIVELIPTTNKYSDELGIDDSTVIGYDDNAIGFNETTAIGY